MNGFQKNIDLVEYDHQIKHTVFQHVGIVVGVGFAPTKTLAKLANYAGIFTTFELANSSPKMMRNKLFAVVHLRTHQH